MEIKLKQNGWQMILRINLLSATGSTAMGKALAPRVSQEWVKVYMN